MKIARLEIENFRTIRHARLEFEGHTLLVGGNNVGKSTICEALDLALGAERMGRNPVAQEHDFYNSEYLDADGVAIPATVEVVVTDLSEEVLRRCATNLEHWHLGERRLLGEGELPALDAGQAIPCLRLVARIVYDAEEDDFTGATYYAHSPNTAEDEPQKVPRAVKQMLGFLYLRALRTGSRALSLERGSLLDIILRLHGARLDLWEKTRSRLKNLDPAIDDSQEALGPILRDIERRLAEYIPMQQDEQPARLFVSQLTRDHLRRTLAFFLSLSPGQEPVPFQQAGTGTLNVLVLALLTFIAEAKHDVVFAMEEPEIALPPHTQRRIVRYLLANTAQCFVTSHSPYIIERFEAEQIRVIRRDADGSVIGTPVRLPDGVKSTTYRMMLRRAIAEAMLGNAVIVAEGQTEQFALCACAEILEKQGDCLPLDVSGTAIVHSGGEGNIGELGLFFKELGLKTFAFYDKKQRRPEEIARRESGFEINCETAYAGAEDLLTAEVPLDRQWQFLEGMREDDAAGKYAIPASRPEDAEIRGKASNVLKHTKGDGTAATLLYLCEPGELPVTIVTFLNGVYAAMAPEPVPGASREVAVPEAVPEALGAPAE